jgi:D-sedoheptulose 7-phosphate isomerase
MHELRAEINEVSGLIQSINLTNILTCSSLIKTCVASGGKLFACDNGGSYCIANHFAGELVGSYKKETNKFYPAILSHRRDAVETAISNDIGLERNLEHQVNVPCETDNILIAISLPGNSKNIINAINSAQDKWCKLIHLTSCTADLKNTSSIDHTFSVLGANIPAIQQAYRCIIHLICQVLEADR